MKNPKILYNLMQLRQRFGVKHFGCKMDLGGLSVVIP